MGLRMSDAQRDHQPGQRLVVGQVGALGEMRAEQPFLGRVTEAEIGLLS